MSGHHKWADIKRERATRPRYTVTADRDGKSWFLKVRELPGVFSQVRRLDRAEEWIRDAIALMLEVPEDSFDVELVPALAPEAEEFVATARFLRNRAAHFVNGSNTYLASTVGYLTRDQNLTMRDVGELLGLSFQRVSQLAADPPTEAAMAALLTLTAQLRPAIETQSGTLAEIVAQTLGDEGMVQAG